MALGVVAAVGIYLTPTTRRASGEKRRVTLIATAIPSEPVHLMWSVGYEGDDEVYVSNGMWNLTRYATPGTRVTLRAWLTRVVGQGSVRCIVKEDWEIVAGPTGNTTCNITYYVR